LVLQLCDIVKRRELTEFLSLFSYYLVTWSDTVFNFYNYFYSV
jgi:hypothetical protein